jgi:hypothetical protein
MEVHVHAEFTRDHVRLVDAAGPCSSHVELLKGDNVRPTRCYDLGDALRGEATIDP